MIKKASILIITFTFSALVIAGIFIYYITASQVQPKVDQKRPNEGYYLDYYEDGVIKAEEHYAHGKKDGIWKRYYPDGQLKDIMKYKGGKLEGEKKHYSITGELIFTEKYLSDILIDMTIWDDSLYRYESNLLNHGKYVFSIDCSPCHEGFEKASVNKMEEMTFQRDTSEVKFMVLDSLHKPYLLASSESDSTYNEDNCLFVFNKTYDLKAVIEFIKKFKVKNDVKPIKMKKLKIKSKTS